MTPPLTEHYDPAEVGLCHGSWHQSNGNVTANKITSPSLIPLQTKTASCTITKDLGTKPSRKAVASCSVFLVFSRDLLHRPPTKDMATTLHALPDFLWLPGGKPQSAIFLPPPPPLVTMEKPDLVNIPTV
ncbi:hypothetical protein RUM44_012304 [Polyplax serrata]|uniref:Uncharacterized protein n=1 Tax=Polyplax serrata TaxID=468196 RepID=A0ABR1BAX9_POLSC